MRTSGRSGGSETLMFLAPAGILAVFFLWQSGGAIPLLSGVDRWLVRSGQALLAALASLVS